MLLTLAAAGTTLLVGAILLGGPAVSACAGDSRGLVQCLRGMVDDRFELGIEPDAAVRPGVPPPAAVAGTPAAAAGPGEPVVDVPPVVAPTEPTRSLVPQPADKPVAPEPTKPDVVSETPPAVPEAAAETQPEAAPDAAEVARELPLGEAADAADPAETISLAKVDEAAAIAAPDLPVEAPPFVPPAAPIEIGGVPPDLATPEPATQAPDFVLPATPDLPTSPPPDLTVTAVEPEPAVAEELSTTPELPATPPPEPEAPAEPAAEPSPDFVLPEGPELPAGPPPDLAVAAVDPAVPTVGAAPAVPVLAPTIDAVEIEGDGNFIAGNGPAGATMRLYVDGIPVGVSPVEGGRWLVEGTDLLTEPRQTLKVEALDPVTGKVLGEAMVAFERPAKPVAETPAAEEPTAPADPVDEEPASSAEEAQGPTPEPASPGAVGDDNEAALPPIRPAVPSVESPSVTILKPSGEDTITTLPTGEPSGDAVVTLGARPAEPAIVAAFTVPEPEEAANVAVLRAVPVGDPGAGRFVSGKAIIRRGDTLWDIAHRFYGRGVHYRTIFRANRELIARPGKIYPGQVFELPLVYDD